MLSIQHEALVELFRNCPGLAVQLLERGLQLQLPDHSEARLADTALNQVVPTEYSADAVVELVGLTGLVAAVLVIEVQLRQDRNKRYSWPVYATSLRASRACPVSVLVITPHESVAAWARQPIDLGFGSTFRPLVVGPDVVPRVTNINEARERPELAVMSVLAHGRSCLLYTSPSPRDLSTSRMPSSA